MRAWAVCAALALALAGCKKKRSVADAALEEYSFPGVRVSLAKGVVEKQGAGFGAGAISIRMNNPRGMSQVRWNAADGAPSRDDLVSIMNMAAAGRARIELGPAQPAQVCGRPAQSYTLTISGIRGVLTTWHHPDEGRYFMLLNLSEGDGGARLHDRVLATVRCTTVPPSQRPQATYPLFTPPSGMGEGTIEDGRKTYQSATEGYVFQEGVQGRMIDSDALDKPDATKTLRRALGDMFSRMGGFTMKDTTDHLAVAPDGSKRFVMSGEADIEGERVALTLMYWYCDQAGLSFVAMHVGPLGGTGPGEQHLLGARCP